MGIDFNNCLVFQTCLQKVAEARVEIDAINAVITGFQLVVNETTGQVTITDGYAPGTPAAFELCCQQAPNFRPILLKNKVINCGWVRGALLIKNANTGATLTCLDVALVFQDELEVPGVLPTDFVDEQVVENEGTAVCIVFETNVKDAAVMPVLVMKCVFTVFLAVLRDEKVLPPICTAPPLCPVEDC